MNSIRILIVFYSRAGTTRRSAAALADMLDADIEEIVDARPRKGPFGYLRSVVEAVRRQPAPIGAPMHDPGAYDLVVVGTPVWGGAVSSPVRAYLGAHRAKFRHVAFFCCFAQRGSETALAQMRGLVGIAPLAECRVTAREALHGDASVVLSNFAERIERELARIGAAENERWSAQAARAFIRRMLDRSAEQRGAAGGGK